MEHCVLFGTPCSIAPQKAALFLEEDLSFPTLYVIDTQQLRRTVENEGEQS